MDAERIDNKLGIMKKNFKKTKEEYGQSGFGVDTEAGDTKIEVTLNRKCHWYTRLDAIMNYPREEPKQQAPKSTQSLQEQPTQGPTMTGDTFSGLPALENAIEIDDDENGGVDGALSDLASPLRLQQQHTAPSTPSAAVVALRSQLGGSSAGPMQYNPRKCTRNAIVDLEDILEVSQKGIAANERTAIEVAKINTEAMEKVAKENTQRHQAILDVL
ncbi:hypothetical protein KEM55_005451 [Ascosphaera atra]|nr:hypothetical protein KEM55_005451 [Ascosphaera atra]